MIPFLETLPKGEWDVRMVKGIVCAWPKGRTEALDVWAVYDANTHTWQELRFGRSATTYNGAAEEASFMAAVLAAALKAAAFRPE